MSSSLFAQDISGDWKGNIEMNGMQIPIIFHFIKDNSGKITGKWDSPKQKAMGLAFSGIDVKDDSVKLDIQMINGFYNGKLVNKDSISGMWHQGGIALPLNFSRSEGDIPEEKNTTAVYPNEKEISITSGLGTPLYGTLLSKNNQQKIAIIIAGSGPTDRNGNSSMSTPTNE